MLRTVANAATLRDSRILRILGYFRNNMFATRKMPYGVRIAV